MTQSSQKSKIKSLAGDTAIYGTFTILGRFLTFLLTPFYTNYMNMSENADIIQIFAVLAFVNVVNCFGMEAAFFRFNRKDDPATTRKVFSHAYIIIAAIAFVTSALGFVFAEEIAPAFTSMERGADLMRLICIIPFLDALVIVPYALLRSTRRAKKFASTRFFVIVCSVALNIFFVVGLRAGSFGVIWAQLLANLICVVVLFPELRQYLEWKFDKQLAKEMLRFGAPTVPANVSAIVMQLADRPILKAFANDEQMAIYGVNRRLAIPMMLFVAVFEYAWKPFYLSNFEEEGAKQLYARVLSYFTLVSAVVFLGSSFFMEYVVRIPFFGGKHLIQQDYWAGLGVVPIILAGYYFNGVYTNVSAGFHITKRTEFFPLSIGIAAIVNLAINIFLVPVFGYPASAWAALIAYVIAAGMLLYHQRKIYPIEYEWKRLGLLIAITTIVYLVTDYATMGMELWLKFFARMAACCAFVALLFITKFFSIGEMQSLRGMVRRKK